MDGMDDKLGALLNNPQLMQQIMTMAQSLGAGQPRQEPPQENNTSAPQLSAPSGEPDLAALSKIAGLAGQTGIDTEQRALLSALGPYLSRRRVEKLEKAMRAAKMARVASIFLNSGGLNNLAGR